MADTRVSQQSELAIIKQVPDIRQVVGFSFYRVDPAWRRLPAATKKAHGEELTDVVDMHSKKLMVRTYSLVGLKPDLDFLIWRVGSRPEELQEMSAAIQRTAMGGYLTAPHS